VREYLTVLDSPDNIRNLIQLVICRNAQEPDHPIVKLDREKEVEGTAARCCDFLDGVGNVNGGSVSGSCAFGTRNHCLWADVAYGCELL
jgi:hypothetical protein